MLGLVSSQDFSFDLNKTTEKEIMKMFGRLLATGLFALGILAFSTITHADSPYAAAALKTAQQNSEKILLHFHADWCPTCKAQKKVLATLEAAGDLKGITTMTVDYDKETELKKELGVTQQSTFVAYYGNVETGRVTGITSEKDIKNFVSEKLSRLTLKDQLELMSKASRAKMPPEVAKIMAAETEKLKKSQLESRALKVGQKMPDFKLPDAHGKMVSLKSMLKTGPVVVTFVRGSWCPYCNAQLSNFKEHMSEFKAKNATLVAITPEKPELTVLMQVNKKLEFAILTDKSNAFASKLGLVFEVGPELKTLYGKFGIDLEKSQGNPDWKLPVPATYVVAKDGKVIYAFVDVDYTKRAEAEDVLKTLN
jgi:peroxiredoxin/glutaredoxin